MTESEPQPRRAANEVGSQGEGPSDSPLDQPSQEATAVSEAATPTEPDAADDTAPVGGSTGGVVGSGSSSPEDAEVRRHAGFDTEYVSVDRPDGGVNRMPIDEAERQTDDPNAIHHDGEGSTRSAQAE